MFFLERSETYIRLRMCFSLQTMSESTTTLGRPFTARSFQKIIRKFDELVEEITLRNDATAGPDERRRFIAGWCTQCDHNLIIFIHQINGRREE